MYFLKWNCATSFPISTFTYLWAIYTYIPTICPPILLQQNRPHSLISGNICFEFSVQYVQYVQWYTVWNLLCLRLLYSCVNKKSFRHPAFLGYCMPHRDSLLYPCGIFLDLFTLKLQLQDACALTSGIFQLPIRVGMLYCMRLWTSGIHAE